MSMSAFCHVHNWPYMDQQCSLCDSDRQAKAQAMAQQASKPFNPSPTLSPEAQAVLDRASKLVAAWKAPGAKDRFGPMTMEEADLEFAVCAWQATQKPKDYAPRDLRLGVRFRFVTGDRIFRIIEDENGKRMMLAEDMWEAAYFCGESRLIPLPEQDGSDRFTTTPDQERDTKW